jgi:hypothetical protein
MKMGENPQITRSGDGFAPAGMAGGGSNQREGTPC